MPSSARAMLMPEVANSAINREQKNLLNFIVIPQRKCPAGKLDLSDRQPKRGRGVAHRLALYHSAHSWRRDGSSCAAKIILPNSSSARQLRSSSQHFNQEYGHRRRRYARNSRGLTDCSRSNLAELLNYFVRQPRYAGEVKVVMYLEIVVAAPLASQR